MYSFVRRAEASQNFNPAYIRIRIVDRPQTLYSVQDEISTGRRPVFVPRQSDTVATTVSRKIVSCDEAKPMSTTWPPGTDHILNRVYNIYNRTLEFTPV